MKFYKRAKSIFSAQKPEQENTGNLQKHLPLHLPVFLTGILLTILFTVFMGYIKMQNDKKTTLHLTEIYATRIESLLDGLFHKTDVLESIIITNRGDIDNSIFQDVAKSLSGGYGIRSIQYLPNGIVTYCYPIEGNEAAIGDNVFENPDRREDANLAVQTKNIALSGPYELLQGGLGLIARNPIFLTDIEGTENFWGFAVIILDLPEALKPIMLDELSNSGYAYRLHFLNSDKEDLTIDESSTFPNEKPVNAVIRVPNHIWTLSLIPKDGWLNKGQLTVYFFLGFCAALLLSNIIYETEAKHKLFQYFAVTDELTGYLNRRGLSDTFELWHRCQKSFIVMYMDLNYFKAVNDIYGHDTGDELLRETAHRLKKALGKDAACGRIGGDEFMALVYGNKEDADSKILSIREAMSSSFLYKGYTLEISPSIGYAIFPDEGTTYDELIKAADERMYQNKRDIKKNSLS